ncbi:MAG: terminase large subunit [Janthinobacterium lividum]
MLRHYEDLVDGAARGIVFSAAHAWHCIDYIQTQFLHIKGSLARTPLILDPWQLFWTANLLGWRNAETGLRRYRTTYEEVARKNGKSTWKAAIADYLFLMDQEPGPEVYTIATTREQAMSVFRPALDNYRRRIKRSKRLARYVKVFEGKNQEQITIGAGVFKPLPANAESLDGLNPSVCVVDELHAHPSREVWDVMESALGSRSQPLISAITTAGYILDGICTEIRAYLVLILKGKKRDDSFFGYIYTLDADDDKFDDTLWIKANPSLGSAKTMEYMRSVARKAADLPSARANFMTKDLNVWVNSALTWFPPEVWDKGGGPLDPRMLAGCECYGGLDMSSTTDITAFVLLFPPDETRSFWCLLAWCFVPRAKIEQESASDAAPYRRWEEEGWLTVTEGAVVDYAVVKDRVVDANRTYALRETAFDSWNTMQLASELIDLDVTMVQVPQTTSGMSGGAKLLERIVYGKNLRHGGNPVVAWCAGNVALYIDPNENIKPNKKTSTGRIDPIVAACMAATRAQLAARETEPEIIVL